MLFNTKTALFFSLLFLTTCGLAQESSIENGGAFKDFQFRGVAEAGYVSVLSHKIQFGENGTYFDYVNNGGQNVLFPTLRFSLEMDFNERNTIILLYQPLRIESSAVLKEDLTANGITFPALTGVDFLYNFPFYRVSYLRELTKKNGKFDFAFGGTIQIRNATISFRSTDGVLYTDNRDIGVVPALKIRSRLNLNEYFYTELEADGIYAPIKYLNGSDNEVVGAILDASLRVGARVNPSSNLFLNLRYLGGGATGAADENAWPGDGYTKNWLHFLNVTAGFVIHL